MQASKWFDPLAENWGALAGITRASAVQQLSKAPQLIPDQMSSRECVSVMNLTDPDMDNLRSARCTVMQALGELPSDSVDALRKVSQVVASWTPARCDKLLCMSV